MRRFVVGLVASICAIGLARCATQSGEEIQDATGVQEAAIRFLMDEDGIDVPYYCLGTWSDTTLLDAAGDLLQRFSRHDPEVVSASTCELSRDGDRHSASGMRAQFFMVIGEPVWEGLRRASVQVRHHVHGRHGASYACVVERSDDAWLPSCTLTAVS